ncbi:TfoX/Sxy family protein [Gammaproteobacteria bacterium AH-315-M22]|nr:TfoX/Sxy family protein [Gammaproteobacteria bacterium AH-315-M22]
MSEFVEYLKEAFREFGVVTIRKMFGGHGIYFDSVMIGLVADDTLYLKADAQSLPKFQEHGLPQFMYAKGEKMVGMSYYLAPEEALEDAAEMRQWARLAYEAALRSRK